MASQDGADGAANSNDNGARAARGASQLILLQVVSRGITFVANQLLLRFLTAQLLGVATQLEVYYLSVIFFARESLRVAIQRQDTSHDENTSKSSQAAVNLGSLAIALGIPLAALFGWLYLGSLSAATLESTPNLVLSLYVYAFASVVELISEPAFVVMQRRLQVGTRVAAESFATFARCIVTLGVAAWGASHTLDLGVLPFAFGQLSYGIGLFLVYTWYGAGLAKREGFSLIPCPIPSTPVAKAGPSQPDNFILAYFHRSTLNLASSLAAQSVLKHLLTQGDTFMVSIFSSPTAQGVYALANNYGGLVARLLFQPIEEISRNYFSRLLAPTTPEDSARKEKSSSPSHTMSPSPAREASTALASLLRAYALLSLIIITLGPTAAPLLLSLVAGPKWASSGAGDCLAAYMWYIPLLAVNGVTEAFVSSVATETEVHWQSLWMGAFSAGFAGAGFIFLRLLDMGAIGLVVANCINMTCRIVWCGVFIRAYFAKKGVGFMALDVMPSPVLVVAAAVTSQAAKRAVHASPPAGAREALMELVRVAAVAIPFVVVLVISERKFLQRGYQALRGSRP